MISAVQLSDAVQITLINSVAPTITALAALGALLFGILNSRKIKETHAAVNGQMADYKTMMQKVSAMEAALAHTAGVAEANARTDKLRTESISEAPIPVLIAEVAKPLPVEAVKK